MHQGGRLQSLAGLLLCQLLGRQLAQFVIDERQQLIRRLRIALAHRVQDPGDVVHHSQG